VFKPDRSKDRQLFAFSLADLIPEDSDVWLYVDLFDEISVEEFDWDYVSQGEAAHEPRLVLRTIFYGLTHGLTSGRKLSDACIYDGRYIVLSGGNKPSYRTFSRFMKRHGDRLESLFIQIVRLAQKMDIVSLGQVAIDGSRFKADTSKHKAMSYGRMELARLRSDLSRINAKEQNTEKLSEEIRLREKRLAKISAAKAALEKENKDGLVNEKAQKSFADHDALPMMKNQSGGFMYGYNCQLAVDSRNQIVVAATVHDNQHDCRALADVLSKIDETCETGAQDILCDTGYFSYENLAEIKARDSRALVARGKGEELPGASLSSELRYYPLQDQFRCRYGKPLFNKNGNARGLRGIAADPSNCKGCPIRQTCQVAAKHGKVFWVPQGAQRIAALANERLMNSEEGKSVYKRRKVIVEPVFGNIKNKGIKIKVRGLGAVRTWWMAAVTAHNIEKVIGTRRNSNER
jgi:transposase